MASARGGRRGAKGMGSIPRRMVGGDLPRRILQRVGRRALCSARSPSGAACLAVLVRQGAVRGPLRAQQPAVMGMASPRRTAADLAEAGAAGTGSPGREIIAGAINHAELPQSHLNRYST